MRIRLRHLALAGVIAAAPLPLTAQVEEARDTTLSVVAGKVVDHATGANVANATIELTPRTAGGAAERRISDDDGTFRFDDVAAGAYTFTVSALGYAATDEVLDVAAQSDVRVMVRLTVAAIALQPLVVETSRRPAFMDGFEERRAHAQRHTGFFTSDEIMALDPKYVSDVFFRVPGARLSPSRIGPDRLLVDGNMAAPNPCPPNVFINGILVGGEDMPYDHFYRPDDVAAVELYALVHNVPQQFRGPRDCGSLVIWLKSGADARQLGATWKRVLIGVAAAVTLLLLAR